jgi:hypothetical protein
LPSPTGGLLRRKGQPRSARWSCPDPGGLIYRRPGIDCSAPNTTACPHLPGPATAIDAKGRHPRFAGWAHRTNSTKSGRPARVRRAGAVGRYADCWSDPPSCVLRPAHGDNLISAHADLLGHRVLGATGFNDRSVLSPFALLQRVRELAVPA